MIPSLTLNALSSGLGHFGVALHGNHIRHIDTYGAVVDNSKTKITCFVRSSESVDVLNILKKSPNISYYVDMITYEAYNFKGEFTELSNLDVDAWNISKNYRKNLIDVFSKCTELIISTDNMSDAVNSAYKVSKPGDVVLLSPACSSFDLFDSYEDRGNKFKEEVRKLWV